MLWWCRQSGWVLKMELKISLIIILILVFIFPFSSLASTGCFLHPDSSYFCQEITEEQAEEECAFFQCNPKEQFQSNNFCLGQEACQKILCKTTCREEYAGRCSSGKAEPSDCTPGCCQFDYYNATYCSYLESKSNCLIEAQNREVLDYRFSSLSKTDCQQICASGKILSSTNEKIQKASSLEPVQPAESSATGKTPIIFFLLPTAIFAAILFYFLWKRAHHQPQVKEEQVKEEKKLPWFFPLPSRPQVQAQINRLKKEHKHRLKHQQGEALLTEAGLISEKEKSADDSFQKLQKLTKKKEPEKSPLQVLEEWAKK